jgi:hypothetical protein
MQQVWTNLFQSKTRLIVILRYFLFLAIVFMGIERFRIMLFYLQQTSTYNNRDVLTYYLIAKATISGVNPYLPLNELAQMYIGPVPFYPHPAPCTPFLTIMFVPLTLLDLNQLTVVWFIVELILLVGIACLLTILWKDRIDWKVSIFIFIILLAWYPVANDLSYGQLSILLTFSLLAGLLASRKKQSVLAGVFIGFTMAVKLITWPLILYFVIKKDWRVVISSCLTAVGLNLIALAAIGVDPFIDYYLHVSSQVLTIYQSAMHNLSLWSIGFRLFGGTGSKIMDNYISAPPLVYLPKIAPIVSMILIITFLVGGLVWASKSKDFNIAFAIMVCVILLVSPLSWAHYFILLVIPLSILFLNLVRRSFPAWQTLVFVILCLLLFLFNEQIVNLVMYFNGGAGIMEANGNHITFASSLISYLPTIEVIVLIFLLWKSGVDHKETLKNVSMRKTEI